MKLYLLAKTEVSTLSPRVAFLDHQRLILNVDNSSLKQRIAALIQDKIFKDGKNIFHQALLTFFTELKSDHLFQIAAHQEALKKEIERLRRVYHEQNMNKADKFGGTTTTGSPIPMTSPAPPAAGSDNCTDD
ncbi:hypothetical protein HanHA300_Chr13g0465781 [Helianthus annuus]|nr:hypothetical protein HanHA300_Chr13g0465781 [Helianthus annuus]KAJ0662348.1 hypothetical protein HanLR1_Chr13g0468401 [Helianthus annuus]KAJ0669873.1 hypothetical protein HanOQP8_Chr13g0467491 [Helianthus annuus]